MKTDELRQSFLSFFKNKKHKILPSDSLVPKDDPTLLFTSAGMNQFKRQFMGKDIKYRRIATVQKCLRTGDLDKVGKTPYHHTFFEMLGNFSFGDYFKKEAMLWSWEFLTDRLNLQPESLWITVYKDDHESFNIWKQVIGIPGKRIIKKGDKDNFWPQEAIIKGPNGPCGPCSEIYFDRGKDKGCGRKSCAPGCPCNRFVEIWNLVFTQYIREGLLGKKVKLRPLPSKNIDTGMGLERLMQVVQNVDSNFEIDIFKPIIDFIVKHTGANYGQDNDATFKVRAIADHIRAITFAVSDGVIPSNEERGYVIRKLIRRSANFLSNLGLNKPFLYKIVPMVTKVMQKAYPDLEQRRENISRIVLEEEKKFSEVLKHAPQLKREKMHKVLADKQLMPSLASAKAGDVAFELYDTYGIPEETSEDWARQILGKKFDEKTFKKELNKKTKEQRDNSRRKSQIKDEIFSKSLQDEIDEIKPTIFVGYEKLKTKSKVLALIKNGKRIDKAKKPDKVEIVLDKTPFYAESGGQIGDTGIMKSDNLEAEVYDTQKLGGVYLHYTKIASGNIKVNQTIEAEVTKDKRLAIAKNHTATHLLQCALRKILGPHVEQSGSLVDDKRLRFDFSHFKQIDDDQIKRIEEVVNNYIQSNDKVKLEYISMDEAKKRKVLAFFKEKYGKTVRLISIGDYSRELCGGTHIDSTGKIGLFKITSQSSIASGIRRIEAVTSKNAFQLTNEEEDILSEIKDLFKTDRFHITQSIKNLIEENKSLKKEISSLKINLFKYKLDNLLAKAKTKDNVKIIVAEIDKADMNSLRILNDLLSEKLDSFISVLASIIKNKVILVTGVSKDLINKGISAKDIIASINQELGARGGGRPSLAQAGGGDPKYLKRTLNKATEVIIKLISKIKGT